MEYTIPVDMLKAALLSVSKEQTRYYLCGVLMQRRQGVLRIVSTDGHRMFVGAINLDDGLQPDFDAILPTADVKKALTGLTRNDDFVQMFLDIADEDVKTVKLNGVEFRPIEGNYVAFDRVLPIEQSGEVAAFDPRYVADLGKAAKLLTGNECGLHIGHNGYNPAIVSFSNRPDCFVVLMPRRNDVSPITKDDIAAIMGQSQAAEKAA